jgi:hypothetical protein
MRQMHARGLSEHIVYAAYEHILVAFVQSKRWIGHQCEAPPLEAQAEVAAKAQYVRMKRLCSAMDTSEDVW